MGAGVWEPTRFKDWDFWLQSSEIFQHLTGALLGLAERNQ